jgi:hypothetical protein
MEDQIEVTTTTVEVGIKDQLAVTVLCALAGMVASKLTEKAYFNVKGRYQIHRAAANQQ